MRAARLSDFRRLEALVQALRHGIFTVARPAPAAAGTATRSSATLHEEGALTQALRHEVFVAPERAPRQLPWSPSSFCAIGQLRDGDVTTADDDDTGDDGSSSDCDDSSDSDSEDGDCGSDTGHLEASDRDHDGNNDSQGDNGGDGGISEFSPHGEERFLGGSASAGAGEHLVR